MKRNIRADKWQYVEDPTMTVGKAEREGNIRQPCNITKKLVGKYGKLERSVRNKEGKPITEIQKQRNRWIGHFGALI